MGPRLFFFEVNERDKKERKTQCKGKRCSYSETPFEPIKNPPKSVAHPQASKSCKKKEILSTFLFLYSSSSRLSISLITVISDRYYDEWVWV